MSKDIEISEQEFYEAMLAAAKASIEAFAKKHEDKTFYGFSIETLAEEGYFQMAFNTEEGLLEIDEKWREDEKWNNQAWAYFDFNQGDEAWNTHWDPMQERINNLKNDSTDRQYAKFMRDSKKASIRVLAELERINVFDQIKKTDYFKTEVFEHHDRW